MRASTAWPRAYGRRISAAPIASRARFAAVRSRSTRHMPSFRVFRLADTKQSGYGRELGHGDDAALLPKPRACSLTLVRNRWTRSGYSDEMDEPLRIGGRILAPRTERCGRTEHIFRAVRRSASSVLHLDQGFCVRFPAALDGEPLGDVGGLERGRLPGGGGFGRTAQPSVIDRRACRSARRAFGCGRWLPPPSPRRRT